MSSNLYRIAYASTSSFKAFEANDTVGDINIAEILQIARENNEKNRLVGALYYGNGCFFQCLEGEKQDIEILYDKLLKDSRHENLKILVAEPIEAKKFSSWEMKFAAIDYEIRHFLRQHQLVKFDPYKFSEDMSYQLIDMLQKADDALSKKLLDETVKTNTSRSKNSEYNLLFIGLFFLALVFGWLLFK